MEENKELETQEKSKDQLNGKKASQNQKPNRAVSFLQNMQSKLMPVILAVLMFSIGGPIGIIAGTSLTAFAFKKEIANGIKKVSDLSKRTLSEKISKRDQKENTKQTVSKEKERASVLEVNKATLNQMSTRLENVSKIGIIPDDQSKSTRNTMRNNSKFKKMTAPNITLSHNALKRRKKEKERKPIPKFDTKLGQRAASRKI
ncbi:hypothetical protein OOZ15_18370 [Galbibacter sp. EGI 63066]|uniref:hypothetical protein n=1 Tax=Galbibacter sp. EGI 63066 TaxID=2993559 RepID=UPI00224943F2|nr:hypothetical protein [Galbibacter sp. EGI 63066]MCX2681923.1 hypothetical protein [Galbibacter sp. EGI 63066]